VAAIAAAIGGALVAETQGLPARWRDDSAWPATSRRALQIWGGAAIGATLANPYLLRAWLFPLELMRRIDGSNGAYLAIGEFRPPFSGSFPTFALGSYQVMIFTLLGLAVLAGWLTASGPRDTPDPATEVEARFDVAPLAFAAALAWLSILARRNIGIFAIGVLPFLGSTLAIVLAHRPKASSNAVRVAGFSVLASAVVIGAQAATNGWPGRLQVQLPDPRDAVLSRAKASGTDVQRHDDGGLPDLGRSQRQGCLHRRAARGLRHPVFPGVPEPLRRHRKLEA
jgi:hypothetical protein